ncbi:MAG: ABC transporter substrate-binding protein [Candidatus Micrarchaeota archaeon]
MVEKRSLFVFALVVAVIVLIVAVMFLPKSIESEKVRFGTVPGITPSAIFFVALDQGYFAEQGIEIEVYNFSATNEIHAALLSGDIDIETITGFPTMIASEIRSPEQFKAIGLIMETPEQPYSYTVVAINSSFTTLSDLSKATIGIPPGSNWKMWSGKIAKVNNWTNVTFVPVNYNLQLAALDSRSVDAIVSTEPFHASAVVTGIGRVVQNHTRGAVMKYAPVGAIMAISNKFSSKNQAKVKKIIAAFESAEQFIARNETEAKRIYGRYTNLDEKIAVASTLPLLKMKISEREIEQVQQLVDLLYAEGEISKPYNATRLYFTTSWK